MAHTAGEALWFLCWTHVAGTLLKLFDAGSQKTSGELSLLLEIVYGERRGESKAKKLEDGQQLARVCGDW